MQVERRAYYFPARKRGRLVEWRASPGCKKAWGKLRNGLWLAGFSSQMPSECRMCILWPPFPCSLWWETKLRLWGLLRFLFLCFAELCFASSSLLILLLPSNSGSLQGTVRASLAWPLNQETFAASGACVRCSAPFPRKQKTALHHWHFPHLLKDEERLERWNRKIPPFY